MVEAYIGKYQDFNSNIQSETSCVGLHILYQMGNLCEHTEMREKRQLASLFDI